MKRPPITAAKLGFTFTLSSSPVETSSALTEGAYFAGSFRPPGRCKVINHRSCAFVRLLPASLGN